MFKTYHATVGTSYPRAGKYAVTHTIKGKIPKEKIPPGMKPKQYFKWVKQQLREAGLYEDRTQGDSHNTRA